MFTGVSKTKDECKKPRIHTFYAHKKDGVDVVDLVSSHNITKMKVKQWPFIVLAFLLDAVRTKTSLRTS